MFVCHLLTGGIRTNRYFAAWLLRVLISAYGHKRVNVQFISGGLEAYYMRQINVSYFYSTLVL